MKKKQKAKLGVKGAMIITVACLLSIMFIPLAMILIIGMAPTFVAGMIDKTPERLKAMTIGFMNFAGCYPFLLTLIARQGNSPEAALHIIFQPMNVIIMYLAAGVGYLIEFGVIHAVSSFLVQTAQNKIKNIAKQQAKMVERWGKEVTGDMPLDAYGFPIKANPDDMANDKK